MINTHFRALALQVTLALLPTQVVAQIATEPRFTNVGRNWASSEPCLIGDANGICSQGLGNSPFLNRPSIVAEIGNDLNRTEGLTGQFERVSDNDDQIWRKLSQAQGREGLFRVRSRYQGGPFAFGIRRGTTADAPYQRIISGLAVATQSKILLSSCVDYEPKHYDGKPRCASFAQHSVDSRMLGIPVGDGELFQFAIERVDGIFDALGGGTLGRAAGALFSRGRSSGSHPSPILVYSSLVSANGGHDRMITFRFNQTAVESGVETQIYLIAFTDGPVGEHADYNDYIVEIRLAEPVAVNR